MSMAAMFDTARELTRSAASSASRLVDTRPLQISEIRLLLNSSSERDVRSGLQSMFALMARGDDADELFADVVKNVTSNDFAIRQMVYNYINMYADGEPELALMTINGIQRTLSSNQNPVARAMALRAMASIDVESISTIVGMAIGEAVNDLSPIVRVACCQAIDLCHSLDPSMAPELLDLLVKLLRDKRDPHVVGWALATLALSFPGRMDMLHKSFRQVCDSLSGFDEWCQAICLPYLVRYCRHFMAEGAPDVERLLRGTAPLLRSMNSAVVVEAAAVYFYLGRPEDFAKFDVANAMVGLKQTELVLQNLVVLVSGRPDAFRRHIMHFFVTPQDSVGAAVLKLKLIDKLVDASNFSLVFAELQFYSQVLEDDRSLTAAMECIASCAAKVPAKMPRVIRWLLATVTSAARPLLVSQSLMALRFLLQQQTEETRSRAATLNQLGRMLDEEDVPADALATTLWLVGEYCREQPALATEVLRRQIKGLPRQPPEVRLQIIQLAAKVYSHFLTDATSFDDRVPGFFEHVIQLSRYDANYDVRDRARMFQVVLNEKPELATLLLQAQKPPPTFVRVEETKFLLNSAPLCVGHALSGYQSLEAWANLGNPADRSDEDDEVVAPSAAFAQPASREVPALAKKTQALSLAEFLESSGEESDDEESEEEEPEGDDSSDVADDDEDDSDV